ncbi:hypothetical protein TNCV_3567831 [Trichonephila clavipes]|nr:hypothetical protein TNCV_3567831 [Trichonephila clavipes]
MRLSVGETLYRWLIDMITSKNPVFHIRLRGCRLSVFVKSPENFRDSGIACFSVRHLTRVTSLTNNSSVFLLVIQATRCRK